MARYPVRDWRLLVTFPEVVGNDYLIGRQIGEGGSGVVHLCRHRKTGEQFAVKIREATDNATPLRFIAEAQAMARLSHPRLVHVVDAGHEGPWYWYAMPFYSKGSVRDRVKELGGRVEPLVALDWTFQTLHGLNAVHKGGLVHRDVKPHNLLLDENDNILITDFGLIRHVSGGVPYRTRTQQSMGTPNYRAPEQAEDAASVDHRADLYGVGATMYFMLTGRRPGFLYMVAAADKELKKVPEEIRPFILKCMAFSPDQRFQDCRSAAEVVCQMAKSYTTPDVPEGWLRTFDRDDRKGIWASILAFLGLG